MMTTRRHFIGVITAVYSLGSGCLSRDSTDGGPRASPDALPAPYLGAEQADVVVRVWEDFRCPHCREFNELVLPALRDRYLADETIKYEHHDFPIPVTEWSWPAAVAARGVQGTTGNEAFWTFAEGVYATEANLSWSTIRDLARRVDAPADTIVQRTRNDYWRPVVAEDKEDGQDRGVRGTPTVFVDEYEVPYGNTWDAFYGNIVGAIEDRLDG